jgi:hypothetical protein
VGGWVGVGWLVGDVVGLGAVSARTVRVCVGCERAGVVTQDRCSAEKYNGGRVGPTRQHTGAPSILKISKARIDELELCEI